MNLSFLPPQIKACLDNLNLNFLSEIRLRCGQPVIIEYKGEYKYLSKFGITEKSNFGIIADDIQNIILQATGGSIYSYAEQIKSGFITVENGVRIGIAGEYVTQNSEVVTIKNITSLNVRIPHNIAGCSDFLFKNLFFDCLRSTVLYSVPGLGKTTMLRDIAINTSKRKNINVLIFDERNEISGLDGNGNGFNLGDRVDVVRCYNKKAAISSAIRAMKPQVIITDELYGDDDIGAIRYAIDCGIIVIASSHVCNKNILKNMPFEFFVELKKIGEAPIIYDKDFNTYCGCNVDDLRRNVSCKDKKEANGSVCSIL